MKVCWLRTTAVVVTSFWALHAQTATPDEWHGLRLNESTPEVVISSLGKPDADKMDAIVISPIARWFRGDIKKKLWRNLTYKAGVEGFGRVDLFFEANKLVLIQLQVKASIRPTALANIYGLEFNPMMSGMQESLANVERHGGKAYPRSFPAFYSVVAVAGGSVVNAYVRNDGLGAVLQKGLGSGLDTAGGGFPGRVALIQLISRRLEDRIGADLLK